MHIYIYIYMRAHIPTKIQHPKPFNPLLSRLLLTKHVEEFSSLSHLTQSSSQECDATANQADLGADMTVTHTNVMPDKLC